MKVKFTASAWSNITYKREEEVDLDIDPIDWQHMTNDEQEEFLNEAALDWLFEDIDFGCEPLEEEDDLPPR